MKCNPVQTELDDSEINDDNYNDRNDECVL